MPGRGMERTAEGLRCLARQERGQVVDGDDGEWGPVLKSVYGHGRLVEGCRDGVDGDGGEGGGGVLRWKLVEHGEGVELGWAYG
jgi:hypothetical protein